MPDESDDLDSLEWYEFPNGDGPEVLTGFSTTCKEGKHKDCPGHGEHEGQTMFCVCPCHKVPAAA
jgi:hypothetical protein